MSNKFFRKPYSLVLHETASQADAAGQDRKEYDSGAQVCFSSGWVVLTITEENQGTKIFEARIFFDTGKGFDTAGGLALNCLNGGVLSSVLYLPANIRRIRLILKTERADAVNIFCRVVPVTRVGALLRIAFYLYRLNRLRGVSTTQIFREKFHQIRKAGVLNIIRNLGNFYDYGAQGRPLDYQEWIQKIEMAENIRRPITPEPVHPQAQVISLACCVTGTVSIGRLVKTLSSVLNQDCPRWQLTFFFDRYAGPELARQLEEKTGGDNRIRIQEGCDFSKRNMIEISLPLMQGDFGLWLNPGDQLSVHAISFFREELIHDNNIKICYCDTDSINEAGIRANPHFKPDWNRELFYAQDYISSACLIDLNAIRSQVEVSRLHKGIEVYDLLLHLLEHISPRSIKHIPKVLYHLLGEQPPRLSSAPARSGLERMAVESHFKRLGVMAQVLPGPLPYNRKINYPLPDKLPSVTIIIPSRDRLELLKKCIASIFAKTSYFPFSIIIVNNDSAESKTIAYLEEAAGNPRMKVIDYHGPFNFSAMNNHAVQATEAEFVCLLNNDIEVITPRWLEEMMCYAIRPEVGCVGAKLLYGSGLVQHAGVICGLGSVAGHAHNFFKANDEGYWGRLQSAQEISAVTAACLLVRKKTYLEVGGMNENELAVAFNDVDFCLKVRRAGYKNVYTPHAELYHYESLSRGADDTPEKRARFAREVAYMWNNWQDELENDPCYNVNLTRIRQDFSLG